MRMVNCVLARLPKPLYNQPMFYIRGGDGKQYGPASSDQVVAWFNEQRLDPQSLVQREGDTEWKPLDEFPEFAHLTHSAATPPAFGLPVGTGARDLALGKVTAPGWAMMVSGVLGILWCLLQLVMIIVQGPQSNPAFELLGMQQTEAQAVGFMLGMIGSSIFGVIWAGFILFAGNQLRTLRTRGVVITACILMMIPCFGNSLPVCLVSLPVGIWGLVVVNNPTVRDQFR
jgi:hypothetical protein